MSRPETSDAGQSTDEEPLQSIFDQAMKLFEKIESGNEATNSDAVQVSVILRLKRNNTNIF